MSKLSIKLGEKTFEIPQLTIQQLMDLRIGDAAAAKLELEGADFWRGLYTTCVDTIVIAASESHPDVKAEEIWKLQCTEDELGRARTAILTHSGIRKAEPTIAELRASIPVKEAELEKLRKTLAEREAKAKATGEG